MIDRGFFLSFYFHFPNFLAEFLIWVSSVLEVGTAEPVSCEVARVFPAKDVVFCMLLGGQALSLFLSWKGGTVWANATVRTMETGVQELSCFCISGSSGTGNKAASACL